MAPRDPPVRERADRILYARRDAGDRRARDELIERFLPLAHSVARRYLRPDEPLDDLVQVASLALVKAVDRFDAGRGYALTTFAMPTIVGELKRHFRDRTWTVRPPRDLQELTLRVERTAERLTAQLDRVPTVAELASATDATDEQILEAMQARAGRTAVSMQAPAGAAPDADAQQMLEDTLGVADAEYEQVEMRVTLDGLLAHLPARHRQVLRLRFDHDLTQAEIGTRLGVSQMQISRIMCHAMGRLREVADQTRPAHARPPASVLGAPRTSQPVAELDRAASGAR